MPHNIIHNIHRAFKTKEELKELYLTAIIHSFAMALIGIFIPIYLLQAGFILNQVFLYMIVLWAMIGLFSPISARIASSIGLKHTILLSIPFYILNLALLVMINSLHPFTYLFVAAIGGIAIALYWVSFNSEFIKNSDKIHEGEEISHLIAFPKVAAIVAPIIGGLILISLGFSTLFIIVILFLILATLPLFITRDYKSAFHFKFSDIKFMVDKVFAMRYFIIGALFMSDLLLWNVYIFLNFGDLLFLGITSSIAGIGVTLFTLIIGKLSDKYDRTLILRIGSFVYAFIWFGRMFVETQFDVIIFSLLGGMFSTFLLIL